MYLKGTAKSSEDLSKSQFLKHLAHPATSLRDGVHDFILYISIFDPVTPIAFYLKSSHVVTVRIFDVNSREVATLAVENFSAGNHVVPWTAGNIPSGIYFYRLQA
jgi:hypothetical protein